MGSRFDEIARRKQLLIERCARDREELAATFQRIRLPLNLGAFFIALGKVLKAYPMAVTGLTSVLVTGIAAKLTRVVRRLLKLLRIIHPLWSWWRKVAAPSKIQRFLGSVRDRAVKHKR